jgi:hypothetical protein
MQTLIRPKTLKSEGIPTAKSLAVIDLGNGQVKALIRPHGSTKFERVSFPSYVAETQESHSDCLKIYGKGNFKNYLVGAAAAEIPMSHTGKTEDGKADNALILVAHALRQAFGTSAHIHCDVIFTTPSNQAYKADVTAKLEGVHQVATPADADVIGSEAISQTIVVHKAVALLEGFQAHKLLKLKEDSWLVDVGNRTIIATKVSADTGRILKRQFFGGCGVRGLAENICQREGLTQFFKEHTPERVIDFLFSDGCPADAIAPDLAKCIAPALAFADDDAPRFVLGGGADVPGMAQALNATPVKNAQWANIKAISDVAEDLV